MQLEKYCGKYLETEKYKHIPPYIKRTSGANKLFYNKIFELHVNGHKYPGEGWETDLYKVSKETIFMFIVNKKFRFCLYNDFNISCLKRLSLIDLFTEDEQSYNIGDKVYIILFDPRLGKQNPQYAKEFIIIDIKPGECLGPIITIKGNFDSWQYGQDTEFFYQAAVLNGSYDSADGLGLCLNS